MDIQTKSTILFFDSGVGGLSVYREVKQLLPNHHYLYCFDNAYFPYSEKPEEKIIERTLKICQRIDQMYPLDLIVIACNTASTVVLPSLREHFSIPIVGTVPAIKPAAEQSMTKHIGLLATKGTVKRKYLSDLIDKYAADCRVEKIGSTKLVELAERKLHGYPIDLNEIKSEVLTWVTMSDLDCVVLGCTHFPLIKSEIQQCLPQVIYFIDSGAAVAKRVESLLSDVKVRSKNQTNNQVFCTKMISPEDGLPNLIQSLGFETLRLLDVDSEVLREI
ncbi:glutamate racemase [Aggregatibacter actinomycetemcomitans]|uniref:Glutamate racemase n=2 Tax=Aggregatibacter actinomycetemcomitans TaxID=714 RepID=A0A142G169_AGGAC|nr:glutamate racemase [Aggregatibacter actinomycetemcomitans]AFI87513.1 glutamate racemase [Aggregatibacter actinomycetemcomitans D7S-1]AMQ94399.1 glutamate racemase [Aggregatibacter actinomycetemcomitans]ANU81819.1 glutamate racemase [Aggregatibacter actinomycetemcomitans]EKX95330.1 glutamate racemase [Aggregatibacter actinomycetemcomitans Y4]KOE66071.1 glutamate racemase [Aggregatibacter actinomycetemcomitans serotype e str. SCC393]